MNEGQQLSKGYIKQIQFEIALMAFVGTLLFMSLGLGSRARIVPQIMGVFTFLLIAWQLAADVSELRRPRAVVVVPTEVEPVQRERAATVPDRDAVISLLLEEEDGPPPEMDHDALRRLKVFAGWVVTYVALSALVGFIVSVPLGLFSILYVGTRRVLKSLIITFVAIVGLYLIFIVMLEVQL
jgi:hypothetical protein